MENKDTKEKKQQNIISKFLLQPTGRTVVPPQEIQQQRRKSGIKGTLLTPFRPLVFVVTHKRITSIQPESDQSRAKATRVHFYPMFCFVFSGNN